tara:strand:- start:43 stop:459 length:417 start_codon:yes stop_codon:yes gene_type:complete
MSTLVIDTIQGKTTAGSVNVRGEGSNNTNLQQGLAKAWAGFDTGGNLGDSLNISSADDDGTGNFGINFIINMANSNYSATTNIADFTHNGSGNNLRCCTVGVRNSNSVEIDQGYTNSSAIFIFYDGAEMCCSVNGDLS